MPHRSIGDLIYLCHEGFFCESTAVLLQYESILCGKTVDNSKLSYGIASWAVVEFIYEGQFKNFNAIYS